MRELKPKRMSRKNLILDAIKYLERETGLHSTNIRFGDGYLIDDCKNGICWFCFKEIKGYTFAMWSKDEINVKAYGPEYENAELIFFTQADLTRDKFKPSRSAFKTPMFRWSWKDNDKDYWEVDWNDCGAVDIIKFIIEHKYRAFFIQSYSDWEAWEYVSGWTAFKEYYRTRIREWLNKEKIKRTKNKIVKDIIRKLKNLDYCKFTLSDYHNCYPALHLFIYFKSKKSEDIEEYNKIMDSLEDKYWKYVSFEYMQNAKDFRKFSNSRIKYDGKGETLLWKKI